MSRSATRSARNAPAFLALSCVGLLACAPALASDADKPEAAEQDRDDVIVTAQKQQQEANVKRVAPLLNTPRSIVELPAEIIQQTGSASLQDALRTVPGITFGAAEGGNPIGDRPFIRGFDSQGSTFVDGVRDVAAQSREVFAIESVQVVRGSDSTLGGRGSAGGSINIISKLPVVGNFVRSSFSAGTADYKRGTADVNYQLGSTVGFRIAAMFHDQDFAGRDAIWAKRWGVAPSLTVGLGGPTQLTVAYYHLTSHELPDSGIPYLYTGTNQPNGTVLSEPAVGRITTISGQTGTVDRSAFYGLKNRDFRDQTTDQATMRVQHDFGGITLRNTSRYSHNDQSYIYTQPDDQQGNVFGTMAANPVPNPSGSIYTGGLVWRRANTRYGYVDTLGNQTDLFGAFDTGSIKHNFAAGFEFDWEKARRGTFVLSSGATVTPTRCNPATIARGYCTSLFNPNPNDTFVNYTTDTSGVATPITKVLPIQETQNDSNTRSAYVFDSITIVPAVLLNLGARYDRFETTVTPGQAATATQTFRVSRVDTLFNWQAGLVLKPTRNTSIYGSYATAATPPNSLIGEGSEGNGLPTTAATLSVLDALKVEKTKSYEVGAKASLFGDQLQLSVAAFQTDTQNARVTGPNNTVEFVGQRRIRGAEFTFSGNLTKTITVFGGYTHLDPKIVDGGVTNLAVAANGAALATTVAVPSVTTGRQATQTARDSATLSTNWQVTPKFGIGGGAYYTSRVYGGYADNRTASQTAAGVITVAPATKTLLRSIAGYTRFDAQASYKFTDAVQLSVNVQNLTNKTYFTQAFSAHYASIAPGRSAFATLNFKY